MPREMPPAAMRTLARQLLEVTQAEYTSDVALTAVVERMRHVLTKFAGAESFTLLLRRSLALACIELPALKHLTISAAGKLDGWHEPTSKELQHADAGVEGAVIVIANLLWLLSTFIGTAFTIRLLRDAWPSIALDPPTVRDGERHE